MTACACGLSIPIGRDRSWVCACSREYDRPRVNHARLVARVDELDRRLKALEAQIVPATVER